MTDPLRAYLEAVEQDRVNDDEFAEHAPCHCCTHQPRLVRMLRRSVEALEAIRRSTDDPNGGKDEPVEGLWTVIGDSYSTANAALADLAAMAKEGEE